MSPSNPVTSKNPNPFLFFKFSYVDAIFVSFHFTLNSSKIVWEWEKKKEAFDVARSSKLSCLSYFSPPFFLSCIFPLY